MTTREQVEAEAEELYPITKALDVDHTAIVIARRRAHVRAKTVTAEQVEAAAYALIEDSTDIEDRGISESTWQEARREVRIVLSRAGLLIERDDDE